MEIFQVLGISPFLAVLAIGFWSGDEAVSKDFRSDISRWLQREISLPLATTVQAIVLSLFRRTFGGKFLSLRFFAVSALFSLFLVSLMAAVLDLFFAVGGHPVLLTSGSLLLVFSVMALANIVADYVSLGETKIVLERFNPTRKLSAFSLIVLDSIFTAAVYLAAFLATFAGAAFLGFLPWTGFFQGALRVLASPLAGAPKSGSGYEIWGFQFSEMAATTVIPLITTFATSLWIWSVVLGSVVFRILAMSRPALKRAKYVLPVDEKPIRSIGLLLGSIAFGLSLCLSVF